MPKKGEDDIVKFRNHERKPKHPFVLYADFESIIQPIKGCKPNPDNSFTTRNAKHIPCGFCIYANFEGKSVTEEEPFVFRGVDGPTTIKTFLERLEMYAKLYYELTRPKNAQTMLMTREDKRYFATASVCHIFEASIDNKDKQEAHGPRRSPDIIMNNVF